DETLAAGVTEVDYRIRWAGPLGATYGGDVHLVGGSPPPPPPPVEPGLFLSRPRPNPAGPIAALDFDLPSPNPGTLDLFDLHGRRMREWTAPGARARDFPLDLNGVGTGLYVLRLEQGSRNTSVRILIVK